MEVGIVFPTESFGFESIKACSLARKAARFSGGKSESTRAWPFPATVEVIEPMELKRVFVPLWILSCTPATGVSFVTPFA